MKQSDAYNMIGDLIDSLTEKKHHAVYEHEYKTDEQLKTRIAVEKKLAASCFAENMDVTETVCNIIEESPDVVNWILNSKDDFLRIKVEMKDCGKKYLKNINHNWNDGAIICNYVTVILGKDYDNYKYINGIHLLTAYPE